MGKCFTSYVYSSRLHITFIIWKALNTVTWTCDLFLFLESRINSAVVRALTFHLCGPGSISWPAVKIDFVGSLLWSESCFLGTPVFPSHQKPTFGLICCDSICFVVSSSSKATVLSKIHWDLNKVIIIIITLQEDNHLSSISSCHKGRRQGPKLTFY